MSSVYSDFKGAKVLITGGLGFIGSNLAIKLCQNGAKVTVLDNMLSLHGGNLFNIDPIKEKLHINFGDIVNENVVNYIVKDQDYIFHLAGQVSHVLSLENPFPDVDINIKGTLVLMEACKKHNQKARVIYTGTRGQYGSCPKLPVSEDAPMDPKGLYELSNMTSEKIVRLYNDNFGIRSISLRLTNIYGPRAQMKHHHFGVANWFVRLAIDGETIKVFGDGQIKRDFLYVDDTVDAIMMAALNDRAYGEVFNVGRNDYTNFLELAKTIIRIAGSGRWEFAPFSKERKALEPGDYYSDISKIRSIVKWQPKTDLDKGIEKTIDYYKRYKSHYWST